MCNFISANFKSRFTHSHKQVNDITNSTQLTTVIYATKVKLLRRVSERYHSVPHYLLRCVDLHCVD